MAEEGRLTPSRRPRVEDVDAEDLKHADERRSAGPDDERREHQLEVAGASQEQRDGGREQRVLAELRRRYGMRGDVVRVVPEPRVEARGADEEDEQAARQPDGPPGAERREAVPETRHERGGADREHGEVGQHGVGGERADLQGEPGWKSIWKKRNGIAAASTAEAGIASWSASARPSRRPGRRSKAWVPPRAATILAPVSRPRRSKG